MTDNIKNAMPFVYYTGTQDVSARAPVTVDEPRAIHTPFIFTLAERGETTPFIGHGDGLKVMLGTKTFDPSSPYYNHATALLDVMNQNANACMVERIKPSGAKTATLQVCIDLLATEVPTYQRLPSGAFELDADNAKIPTGTTVPGFVGKYVIRPVTGALGTTKETVGSLVDGAVQSRLIPLFEFEVSSFGKFGDNYGIKMYPLYNTGTSPVDEELVISEKSLLVRMEIVERVNPRTSPVVVRTLAGAPSVDFMLKPKTLNARVNREMFIDKVALKAYRDLKDRSTGVPAFGPFSTIYTYHTNVAMVSGLIYNAEKELSDLGSTAPEDVFLADIFQGRTLGGYAYHSFVLKGVLDGGVSMNAESIHYCSGGNDGDLSLEAFDAAVAAKLSNFGSGEYLYGNKARYPFSAFYDTGFGMDTKLMIPKILAVRPNAHIALACQTFGAPLNSIVDDSSVGIGLRAAIRSQPESAYFGTSACRGIVVAHAGRLANSTYEEYLPGVFEIAIWRAKYLGAGDGKMKSAYAYDGDPGNRVKYMVDLTNLDKPTNVRNRDWDNGIVWFEDFDTRDAFCPAVQTVYDDDSSILNNDINMQIVCELNTVAFQVWKRLTGNARLTNDQFIKRSNELLNQYIQFRFDGRGVFVPETFYTPADDARGYSWSCRIHFYGNNSKTVATSTVVTHRLEDLK